MPQPSDSAEWLDMSCLLAAVLGILLGVALAALGQLPLAWRSRRQPAWRAGALAAVQAALFAAGTGGGHSVMAAAVVGAAFGAWRVRKRDLTRRPLLVALAGIATGLAVMTGGFARYLFSAAQANAERIERIELYAAVFMGALIFAASAIAFCKLLGVLQASAAARPGHRIVNLFALLLCGWLGYGFVTEQAQPFGFAALLAMSALACAMGVHLMTSREYSNDHASNHGSHAHAFAARRDGLIAGQSGLLARIEWRGGEEQAWAWREIAPGRVRAASRHRRGWHDSRNLDRQKRRCVRDLGSHSAMRRQI
ncbi:UNVERIFIED_ORG: NAD(P) transhydrogenase subunit beta [Burkholderia sp. 1263]